MNWEDRLAKIIYVEDFIELKKQFKDSGIESPELERQFNNFEQLYKELGIWI